MSSFFETKIEFLKGVGPQKAALLNKELNIFSFGDLLQHFPFRYEDRTKIYPISQLNASMPYVQIKGIVRHHEMTGYRNKQRLVIYFQDSSGEIELIWFQGARWVMKKIKKGIEYLVFGKPALFGSKLYIPHPEMEEFPEDMEQLLHLQPVYPSTEKLKSRFLDSRGISRLQKELLIKALPNIKETLPWHIIDQYRLMSKKEAYKEIHFPENQISLSKAQFRLKFEELFYVQLRLLKLKLTRFNKFEGLVFSNTVLLNTFYHQHLPFELTGAQKKVIREIFMDMKSGHQMNRLLQGDVGSGKTIVAFISMLLAIGNDAQATLMAPTEILAEQHYRSLKNYGDLLGLNISLLTGSTKKSIKKESR
jgi:ATP-dependent DNA helicase RecG